MRINLLDQYRGWLRLFLALSLLLLTASVSIAACRGPYFSYEYADAACKAERVSTQAFCSNSSVSGECGTPTHNAIFNYSACHPDPQGCKYPYFSDSCPAGESVVPETGACVPTDQNPAPQKNFGPCNGPSDFAGNPIKTSTGNKFARETDLEGFRSGVLRLVRSYNSGLALLDIPQPVWRHSYERRIREITSSSGLFRAADRPDGRTLYFRRTSGSQTLWTTDADVHEKLTHTKQPGSNAIAEYSLELTDQTVEIYDENGVLQSITYVDGSTETLTYLAGLLDRVDADTGEYLLFGYDAQDRLSTLTDHTGRLWTYTYDTNGNLEYVYYPDGSTDTYTNNPYRRYHYDDTSLPSALTGISDWVRGQEERYATFLYDSIGRATASYHGPQTSVETDRIDGVTISYDDAVTRTVTNSNGNSSTYTVLNQLGTYQLTGISGPGCGTCGSGESSYTQDASNNLQTRTHNGVTTEYGNHDANGNPRYRIEAVGTTEQRRTDFTYDAVFKDKITTITEPSVRAVNPTVQCTSGVDCKVTTYTYDSFGNRTSETVDGHASDGQGGWLPVSRTTTWQFNGPLHQLTQIDGPRDNVTDVADITTFRYYPDDLQEGANRARLKEIEDATGMLTRSNIQYTATGKVASEDRSNGLSLTYTYYPGNDRLETLTESDGTTSKVTRWTYLATGEVETITTADDTPDATTVTFTYDDARRLTRITDGRDNYIEYILDTEGNREAENIHDSAGGLKKVLAQTFDSYNRLDYRQSGDDPGNPGTPLETRDPVYDDNDELPDHLIDGEGTSTDYSYDALNRLTTMVQDSAGLNAQTQYDYDVADRLTQVIDPINGTTTYQYDDLGNLPQTTSPDTGTTVYTYDAAGNVKTKTTAHGSTEAVMLTYSYDALNRLESVTTPDPLGNIGYTWDDCVNGTGRLCKVENGASKIFYSYDAFGNIAAQQSLAYGYDAANRVQTLTYPSGAKLTYHYDLAGQVDQVDLTVDGPTQPLASSITYAPFGEVTGLAYGNGKTLGQGFDSAYRFTDQSVTGALGLGYTVYDANGNLETRTDSYSSTGTFAYDLLNRLDTASGPFGSNWGYDYDLNGNRLLTDEGTSVSLTYESNSNRLDQIGSANVILDVAGNTLAQGDWSYSYTVHNRLASADHLGNPVASFAYNGLGQRVTKDRPDGSGQRFLYGLNGELLVETDAAGNVLVEYLYLNGTLLAVYHPDTDDDGQTNAEEDVLGTNPVVADDDNDGLSNVDELLVHGTSLANPDTDGDGVNDGDEVLDGTNPLDAGKYLLKGDINYDGQVDIVDYLLLTQFILETRQPNSEEVIAGDMNRDDVLNTGDLVILSRTIFGLVWNGFTDTAFAQILLALWEGVLPTAQADVARGKLYYVHNDHLGTPQVMTDEAGTVVWRATYDPFGKAAITVNTVTLDVRFPGQYYDQETGLYYNYYRYYDPETGRYITSDPIGLQGGLNSYTYVNGNPIKAIDPLGLCKIEVRFSRVFTIAGIPLYHGYIVTSEGSGTPRYYRGGPEKNGWKGAWGNIVTRHGDYVPDTPDWDPGTPPSITVLDNCEPCSKYDTGLEQMMMRIDAAGIPYQLSGPNSNSVVTKGLEGIGLEAGSPPVSAPGWGQPIQ